MTTKPRNSPLSARELPPIQEVERHTVFGVVRRAGLYFPMRFTVAGDEVEDEAQCGPAGPYRQIAYQYVQGALMNFCASLSLKEAQKP